MFSSANPWLPSGHPPPPALGMGTRTRTSRCHCCWPVLMLGTQALCRVPAILPQNRNIDAAASYRTTARGLVIFKKSLVVSHEAYTGLDVSNYLNFSTSKYLNKYLLFSFENILETVGASDLNV